MDYKQIDEMLTQGKVEELIELLEPRMEEYFEYEMLTLCKAYLHTGEEKKAKK